VYTKKELEIVDYVENENPQSIENKEEKIAKLKSAVSAKYSLLSST